MNSYRISKSTHQNSVWQCTVTTLVVMVLVSELVSFHSVHCLKASCTICGQRCLYACGTEAFRPCCLSYNRKRSETTTQPPESTPASEQFKLPVSSMEEMSMDRPYSYTETPVPSIIRLNNSPRSIYQNRLNQAKILPRKSKFCLS